MLKLLLLHVISPLWTPSWGCFQQRAFCSHCKLQNVFTHEFAYDSKSAPACSVSWWKHKAQETQRSMKINIKYEEMHATPVYKTSYTYVNFCTLAVEKVRVSWMEPLRPLQETESLPVCDICSFSSLLCCSRV